MSAAHAHEGGTPPRYATVGPGYLVPGWLWRRLVAEVGPARAADLASDPDTLREVLTVLRGRVLADWQRRHGRRPIAEWRRREKCGSAEVAS